jgi:hypothetical protein
MSSNPADTGTAGFNFTSVDEILQEDYRAGGLTKATYIDNPFWALMNKKRVKQMTGRHFVFPLQYATGQGRSAVFTTSQTQGNATSSGIADFFVTHTTNYATAGITTQAQLFTDSTDGGFERVIKLAIDDSMANLGLSQAQNAYGDGSGVKGIVNSIANAATGIITFAIPDQALLFEVGQKLDFVAPSGSSGPPWSSTVLSAGTDGNYYVVAVDRNAGNITISKTYNSTTGTNYNAATTGYNSAITSGVGVLVYNDFNACMTGVQAWIPYGGPVNDTGTYGSTGNGSFMGVNRLVDPVRLAGNWLNGTNMSIEDALITGATNVAKQSGNVGNKLTHYLMSFNKYAQLCKSTGAKEFYTSSPADTDPAKISFKTFMLNTPAGDVEVMPDRNCPADHIFGLNIDTWTFMYAGPEPVSLYDLDGNKWLRQATADGMEIRFYSIGNTVCERPSSNINIQVAP